MTSPRPEPTIGPSYDAAAGRALSPVIAAVSLATIGMLPVALAGANSPLLFEDLGVAPFALGLVVAGFFAAAASSSAPAGRLSARIGPRRTARFAGLTIAGSLLFSGAFARSWETLILGSLVAGAGNAMAQVAANHLLVVGVPAHRHGIAYGLKQSAIPLASVVGGLSLPLVSQPFGWPVPFLIAAACAITAAWVIPSIAITPSQAAPEQPAAVARRVLIVVALAATLGSAAGNSLTPFLPASVTAEGLDAASAGLLLALGAGTGVGIRIVAGLIADHSQVSTLTFIAILLAAGSAGMFGLALALKGALLVGAVVLSFGGGWGWAGLLTLTVARSRGENSAAAFGLVAIGPYLGAVVGPAAFGVLADAASYGMAWLLMALVLIAGSVVALTGTRRLD